MFRELPFPVGAVCASAVLTITGVALILWRTRRRRVAEPRCGRCDYLLVGIGSARCPECGEPIGNHPDAAKGRKRRSPVRVCLGLGLLLAGPLISWKPATAWWDSVYWYKYKSSSALLRDLKRGAGVTPPANNPLQPVFFSHGWAWEGVDLGRCALRELQERDKAGKLPPEIRHEIDEFELANLYSPVGGAVEFYLGDELADRLAAGKLTAQEEATIYGKAVSLTLSTPPVVAQWNPVRILLTPSVCLPNGRNTAYLIQASYPCVRIDGTEVSWSDKPSRQSQTDQVWGVPITRWITYATPGRHRLDLDVQVDVYSRSRQGPFLPGPKVHTERRTLTAWFTEVEPPLGIKLVRFFHDPQHEACHYLSTPLLQRAVARWLPAFRNLAFEELIRRDGLGELPSGEVDVMVDRLLAVQRDPRLEWNDRFGDYIEGLRSDRRLSDARWTRYVQHQLRFFLRATPEIAFGEPLPVEMVTARRRGNSHVPSYSASQWWMDRFQFDGVPQSIPLARSDGTFGEDVGWVPEPGVEYVRRRIALLPHAEPGHHVLRAWLKYDTTWTDRPLSMEIPTEYDLGEVEFTVLPGAPVTHRRIEGATLGGEIARCIAVSDVNRWEDGSLTLTIDVHRPPIGVALHVHVEAGGQSWDLGEIAVARGQESQDRFGFFRLQDARDMPTSGLRFHFTSDADLARRAVGITDYWEGDFRIGPVSLAGDKWRRAR